MAGRYKIIRFVIIFIFLTMITGAASAATITVDDDREANYANIQDAIDNANSGDIILVNPGTYRENVNVNKPLTIISRSENPNDTVVQAGKNSHVFHITSDNVTVIGFKITGTHGPTKAGIYLDGVEKCTIANNILSKNEDGIGLVSSSNNTLINNNINSNSFEGIDLERSSNNELSNNTISSNIWNGIFLEASNNNRFSNNIINSNHLNGISFINSNNSKINNNTINSNGQNGIFLDISNNNTLNDNFLLNNSKGIRADYTENHIYDNHINDREVPGIPFVNTLITTIILGICCMFIRKKQK
ncbi:right-handed parallel beta-helix repeat-containing protein [Methanococcoides burtonii]|uniref:Cell surface glycoprotein n=1 Tax=Methanococcoides burtonii (strain DSM 6242 / NBRC 107633 / OCM 468 / ACE-M) TaxID=259564 RepID=Q12ZN8_METBU|nr:NosD domain-containing protein [Methanococcoides burtonii]ABE51088.1 Cell surface glycoprotein [Methanococcoides burtonii DSM 6242]